MKPEFRAMIAAVVYAIFLTIVLPHNPAQFVANVVGTVAVFFASFYFYRLVDEYRPLLDALQD